LPRGWELIKILLARAEDEPANLTDPMTRALNTEKGRAIGAMYNHALRVCRVAQKNGTSLDQAWATLEPTFESELAKCRDANFDFSTLSASYIANLDYMSHNWLAANVKRLFPVDYPINLKVALGGLAYATPTRVIYGLLVSNGILDAAFRTELEDRSSKERIVEWVCLAYLWGDEALEAPLMAHIFAGGSDDLQNASEFFWQVRRQDLTSDQVERVLAFWAKCLEWANGQPEVPTKLLSSLGRLAPYVHALDDRAKNLLLGIVPYVHADYSTHQMIEEFDQLVDTNPQATVELLQRMFEVGTPNYDMDDKLKSLLKKLNDLGYRADVLHIVEKLRKTLPGMLDFYKQLVAQSPKE